MSAILMFINCEGQSHKTVSTDHYLWSGERRAEADSNRGPSAYQPNALPPGQTGSPAGNNGFCGRYWSRPCLFTLMVFALVKNGSDVGVSPVTWDRVQGGRRLELLGHTGYPQFWAWASLQVLQGGPAWASLQVLQGGPAWAGRSETSVMVHYTYWFRSNVGIAAHLTDHRGWNSGDAFRCPVMRRFLHLPVLTKRLPGPPCLTNWSDTDLCWKFHFDFEVSLQANLHLAVLPKPATGKCNHLVRFGYSKDYTEHKCICNLSLESLAGY